MAPILRETFADPYLARTNLGARSRLRIVLPAAVRVVAVLILCDIVNDRRLDPSHHLKEFLGRFWMNPVRNRIAGEM